jgi:hypothetical protein
MGVATTWADDAAKPLPEHVRTEQLHELLSQRVVHAEFQQQRLDVVSQAIAEKYRLPLVIERIAVSPSELPTITLMVEEVTVAKLLQLVATTAGVAVDTDPVDQSPQRRQVIFTTHARKRELHAEWTRRTSSTAALAARLKGALREQTSASFTETGLDNALSYLGDLHNVRLHIDAEVDLSGKRISLETDQLTLRSLLAQMLPQFDLGFYQAGGTLVIATRAKADALRSTRVYPLPAWTGSGPKPEDLEKACRSALGTVEKELAFEMTVLDGCLAVTANERQHAGIDEFLEQLRAVVEATHANRHALEGVPLPKVSAR